MTRLTEDELLARDDARRPRRRTSRQIARDAYVGMLLRQEMADEAHADGDHADRADVAHMYWSRNPYPSCRACRAAADKELA